MPIVGERVEKQIEVLKALQILKARRFGYEYDPITGDISFLEPPRHGVAVRAYRRLKHQPRLRQISISESEPKVAAFTGGVGGYTREVAFYEAPLGAGSEAAARAILIDCPDLYDRDALYGKYVRRRARYKAHDETNQYKVGDEVEIQEHRPISRDKRFVVVRLVKKFVEE